MLQCFWPLVWRTLIHILTEFRIKTGKWLLTGLGREASDSHTLLWDPDDIEWGGDSLESHLSREIMIPE